MLKRLAALLLALLMAFSLAACADDGLSDDVVRTIIPPPFPDPPEEEEIVWPELEGDEDFGNGGMYAPENIDENASGGDIAPTESDSANDID